MRARAGVSSGSEITTVPTAAERSGDLSALLGAYICADGTTSATACANPVKVTTTEGQTVAAQAGMVFDPSTGKPDGTGREAVFHQRASERPHSRGAHGEAAYLPADAQLRRPRDRRSIITQLRSGS